MEAVGARRGVRASFLPPPEPNPEDYFSPEQVNAALYAEYFTADREVDPEEGKRLDELERVEAYVSGMVDDFETEPTLADLLSEDRRDLFYAEGKFGNKFSGPIPEVRRAMEEIMGDADNPGGEEDLDPEIAELMGLERELRGEVDAAGDPSPAGAAGGQRGTVSSSRSAGNGSAAVRDSRGQVLFEGSAVDMDPLTFANEIDLPDEDLLANDVVVRDPKVAALVGDSTEEDDLAVDPFVSYKYRNRGGLGSREMAELNASYDFDNILATELQVEHAATEHLIFSTMSRIYSMGRSNTRVEDYHVSRGRANFLRQRAVPYYRYVTEVRRLERALDRMKEIDRPSQSNEPDNRSVKSKTYCEPLSSAFPGLGYHMEKIQRDYETEMGLASREMAMEELERHLAGEDDTAFDDDEN